MNQYLGKDVSHVFGAEGYNYSKVVFSKGRPILDAELNLMQELQENMARRATAEMASGWITKRPVATSDSSDMTDSFYTQDSNGAIPEIALVNGWPLVVTNTGTDLDFVNKVDLSSIPLIKGSRADGVFLEVWRALISEEFKDITQPSATSVVTSLNGIWAVDATHAWAVGNHGVLLHTDNAGVSWISQQSPTSVNLNAVYFRDASNGYILGDAGTLFSTDNGGTTWEKIALQVTDDLLAISGILPSFIWVVGRNGIILKSIDGTQFRQVAPGKVSTDLRDIHFYDSAIGWACGASGVLLKTSNGGDSWTRVPVTVPDQNGIEQTVSANLNSVRFVNLNDGWMVGDAGLILRATDGGLRWGDTSGSVFDPGQGSYNRSTANLLSLSVVKSFPLRISLALHDSAYFRSASYSLTPTTIVLRYVRTSDNASFSVTLNLATYATDLQLRDAINALETSDHRRIYDASLGYTNSSYESHETSGSLYGSGSTEIRFSMGDRAWIAGTRGTVLATTNSGAQWTVEASGTGFDLKATSFSSSSTGWAVGDQGIVTSYVPSTWTVQGTDLGSRAQDKVYFEGNHLASVSRNPNLDSVAPDLMVGTADRVQTQYRIRVAEGVDLGNFQEAGLGSSYTFSQGPNDNVLLAGSYSYENMGATDGDYGLWRAKCRNTVDGYSYAIPMFLVSRRNSTPYDASNNINGATVPAISVVRPDGLLQGTIVAEDIVDIRKTVSTIDYQQILEGTLDNLLENKLRTQMWRSPEYGTQIGSSVLAKDVYASAPELNRLVTGGVNAAAIGGLTGFIGPQDGLGIKADPAGTLPAPADLLFPVYQNSVWDHRTSQFTAVYAGASDPTINGTPIPGGFTGMGTANASFVLGATGVLTGANVSGLHYLFMGQRIDYNTLGLSKSVDVPLSVRNLDGQSTANTVYYHSFRTDAGVTKAKVYPTDITGVSNFLEILPIYSSNAAVPTSSATRMHIFQQPVATTTLLTVPKDYQGYSMLSVEAVIGANGTLHRILKVEDRVIDPTTGLTDNSVLAIHLEAAYPVGADAVVELILGVNEVPSNSSGYLTTAVLGLKGTDRGETTSSFSNPNICATDPRTRAVEGFYRSILVQSTLSLGSADVSVTTPNGETIVGLAAYPTLDTPTNYHCWYTTDTVDDLSNPSAVSAKMTTVSLDMAIAKPVSGFGTSTLSFSLKPGAISLSAQGAVVVALYVQDRVMENSVPTASAEVYYRTTVPQALDNLPSALDIQVLQTYPSMLISSSGIGGGLAPEPYQDPLTQIAVNDATVGSESFYFNLLGLQMASYTEKAGYTVQPLNLFRTVGSTVTLSQPSSDHFGRYFYQRSSVPLVYKAQPLVLGNPRKVFVPLLVRVASAVVSPVLRGEVLLAIVSRSLNTELDNVIRLDGNDNGTSIAFYRVPGMPLIRG